MISSDEQRKRREAMEYAIRTVEMEGFTFTEEEKKVFEDIVLGKTTVEEEIEKMKKLAYQLGSGNKDK
ncbi:MAG TPA: antitoxin VbhA family protein [Firmicutes bacterium]|jgi:predicted membrane GTPase involved in stress response|nr:antitoxin VbhA family protein [Bacillota bacterium]